MALSFRSCAIALCLALAAVPAFAQTIGTVAGNGTAAFAGDSGLATAASLNSPQGVAVDGSGNIYIADRNNHRVRKVNTAGVITTFAGTGVGGYNGDGIAATSARLNAPVGLATDTSGNLYIADSNNHRVRKVDAAGVITTVAGTGTPGYTGDNVAATSSGLLAPFGVAWAGDLYIADAGNNRVRRVSGGVITTAAGTGVAGFSGEGGHPLSAALNAPVGVSFGGDGALYIADYGNRRIRKADGGSIVTVAGDGDAAFEGDGDLATSASLNGPFHAIRASNGDLYIADSGNHRIRKVTAGVISTFAGTGTASFGGDGGSPDGGSLSGPAGLALFPWGTLLIADSGNNRVRSVTFPGSSFNLFVTRSGVGAGLVESAPVGIVCGIDCTLDFAPLTRVTLTALPTVESSFAGWTGVTCEEGQASVTCTFAMTANVTVNAAFDSPTYTLTATTNGAPGTVQMNVGSCVGGCSAVVPHGTAVTLSAHPDTQVTFMGWSGVTCDGGNSNATCSFVAGANVAAIATFGYEVQINKAGIGSGSISSTAPELDCDAACTFRMFAYLPGTTITLTAAAAPGFVFDGWEGGYCSGTGPCNITVSTFTPVTARFSSPVVVPPSAPTLVSATGGDGVITVRFAPPANDGNGAVTSYHVQCVPGSHVAIGTASPLVVTGVTNGTTYACAATALNSAGPGTSAASVKATPLATITRPLAYVATDTGVAVIDGATYKVNATIGFPARAVAVDPSATRVYAIDSNTNELRVIDAASNGIVASMGAGGTPLSIVFRRSGGRAYIGLDMGMGIVVMDTATLAPMDVIDVDASFSALAIKPDGSRLYGVWGSKLHVINPATKNISLADHGLPSSLGGVAVNPAGTRIYVNGDNFPTFGATSAMDAEALNVVASVPSPYPSPQALALSPTGSRSYVVSGFAGSKVVAIDNTTDTEHLSRELIASPSCGVCSKGFAAAYPDDARIIAGFRGNTGAGPDVYALHVLDTGLEIIRTLDPDLVPNAVAIAPSVPGAPTIEAATPGSGTVSIAFTPPALDGGSPITGYTVSCNGGSHSASGAASPILVSPFPVGSPFSCSVTATNAVGTSAPSAMVDGSIDQSPAAFAFTPVTGVARGSVQTSNTITVSGINVPAPISVTGGAYSIGCTTTFVTSGATVSNGQTVCVRHTASANYSTATHTTLDIGGAQATFTSTTLALVEVPGAPTIGTATAGIGQATVTFTPPASNGGAAITSYTVTSAPSGFTASAAASPIVVTGLTNGTAYTFTVTATNSVGTGPASAASNAVTPMPAPTVPGVSTGVSATAGNAQATVSFTAPASNGGAAITSYTVTSTPGGLTASAAASPIIVPGLTNGTAYTFTVKATNAVGTGPASAASNAVTPTTAATVPGAPTGVNATAGNTQATVSFTPPASNGGAAVTSYTATSTPSGFIASASASPITVTGLANGTAYTFTVTAANVIGTGPASAASNAVTPTVPATVPGAPSGVSAMAGNAQATVSFTAPASNGGSAITSFTVRSSPGGISASDTVSPITVAGLTNGTAYTFTVTATNGVGAGPASAASNSVTPAAPNPPRLGNISTRSQVLTGDDVMIAGLVIGGTTNKTVVVRARGPSLADFGIAGFLPNPRLQLFSGPTVIASNDDWGLAANAAQVTASGFAPAHPQESAILMNLAPGAYSAVVSGVGNTTGVSIVEVFEVDAIDVPLINIATRSRVQTGDNVLIAGIVVQGSGPQQVVIRARGPSLADFGIVGFLPNPKLQIFSGPTVIAENDDWQQASNSAQIQSSGFAPAHANESAILMTLQPGAYSAIVSGVGGGTGVAIVEVFAQ